MTDITIHKVQDAADRSLPVFAEVERLMQDIGQRAREICERRGFAEGHAIDDWLQAEHEVCWPAAEFVEREREFELDVALAGYAPSEIEITATPREVVVHARGKTALDEARKEPAGSVRWSEFRANDVFRRVELPEEIDVRQAKASLKHGMLRITMPRAAVPAKHLPIASAA